MRTRQYWADVARVVAIVSVVMNHAVSRTFAVYEGAKLELETLPWYLTAVKLGCYVFSRLGVPLFLMLTGHLLLSRDYSTNEKVKYFLKHHWMRLLITAELWYAIMYWYLSIGPNSILRTEGFVAALKGFVLTLLFVNQQTMGSMWYMPMILCIYLLLPMVSLAVTRYEERVVLLPVTFVIVAGMVIPNINASLRMTGATTLLTYELEDSYLFSIYLAYVILGYYIGKGAMAKAPKAVVVFGACASFAMTCGYQLWAYGKGTGYAVLYNFIGILLCACFLFEWIRRGKEPGERGRSAMAYLSKRAFGVYFIHVCILSGVCQVLSKVSLPQLVRLPLLVGVSFIGSLVLIVIFSRVKFCRKYLFLIKD